MIASNKSALQEANKLASRALAVELAEALQAMARDQKGALEVADVALARARLAGLLTEHS